MKWTSRRAWRGEVHAAALPTGLKRVIIPVHIKETQREFRVLHQRRNYPGGPPPPGSGSMGLPLWRHRVGNVPAAQPAGLRPAGAAPPGAGGCLHRGPFHNLPGSPAAHPGHARPHWWITELRSGRRRGGGQGGPRWRRPRLPRRAPRFSSSTSVATGHGSRA